MPTSTPPPPVTDEFVADWRRWHARHEVQRADPHGFLAITGLHRLTAQPQRFDTAPGAWSTGAEGVVVQLAEGEHLDRDGVPLTGRAALGRIAERDQVLLTSGEVVVEVARRGGQDLVRPRDPRHLERRGYSGTRTFPTDEQWAIEGRYVPFPSPRPTTVGSVAEGLEHVYAAPGQVEFEVDGRLQRLTVFEGAAPESLTALFTDATSGVTTYPANRVLAIGPPDDAGGVLLDFNRATNLPCAYTPFATCPLPPPENRLALEVTAGELAP